MSSRLPPFTPVWALGAGCWNWRGGVTLAPGVFLASGCSALSYQVGWDNGEQPSSGCEKSLTRHSYRREPSEYLCARACERVRGRDSEKEKTVSDREPSSTAVAVNAGL